MEYLDDNDPVDRYVKAMRPKWAEMERQDRMAGLCNKTWVQMSRNGKHSDKEPDAYLAAMNLAAVDENGEFTSASPKQARELARQFLNLSHSGQQAYPAADPLNPRAVSRSTYSATDDAQPSGRQTVWVRKLRG